MVTMVYLLIFPSVIKLRYSHPDVPRPYRIPFGKIGLWTAGILTTAWCALTTIAIIYPGIGTAHPDASLPEGFEGQRLEYTLSQVIPLVVMILIGLLFYALGARPGGKRELMPYPAVPDRSEPPEASGKPVQRNHVGLSRVRLSVPDDR
jgi:amino acid transporter